MGRISEESRSFSRRDFLKLAGQIGGVVFLSIWGKRHVDASSPGVPTMMPWPSATQSPEHEAPQASPTPQSTPTDTATPLPKDTSTPTSTTAPTRTKRPSKTPRPSPTKRPTETLTPTRTPDKTVKFFPSVDNFEQVAEFLSMAVNATNAIQVGKATIDASDLTENYDDFSWRKYEEYLRGERPYKYLVFDEYRKELSSKAKKYVRARVIVTQVDEFFTSEMAYLNEVLRYMHDVYKVDISEITDEQKFYIARDITEYSQRFTCIKFLRLVWALFGDKDGSTRGIFPQVYQVRIINAGELAFQFLGGGGKSLFAYENLYTIRQSLVRNGDITSIHPEDRPEMFDGKVMVYFRAQNGSTEPGHVGVGKLTAEYSMNGDLRQFLITYLEVDGYSGQAHYGYRIPLDEFRRVLYAELDKKAFITRRPIGWIYNRHLEE